MDATIWDHTNRLWEMWPVLTASRKPDAVARRRRKFRLMAVALCRNVWDLLDDERSRKAVEVAERFADGRADDAALAGAKTEAWWAYCRGDGPRVEAAQRSGRRPIDYGLADHAAGWVAHKDSLQAARQTTSSVAWVRSSAIDKESVWQAFDLIRETFGNPFRPPAFDDTWRTPDVMSLAQAVYEQRWVPSGWLDNARVGVLADAVEEAGCTDASILKHLRAKHAHVRGCWALDLMLGNG
jgi:hypothetical protein